MAQERQSSGVFRFWGNLSQGQQIILAGTVVAIIAVIIVGGMLISRAGYSVLYSGLAPEEAGQVVEKLEQRNIPYKISGAGGTILVPTGKVYSARIDLAGDGLPRSGTVGFEVFDKTVFGMTEFLQKVNYRRALEGELAKTIAEMEEVDGVRVHIVVPERALFKQDDQPATASVVLRASAARTLSERHIEGIAYLVASAVEGLEPGRVTILDSRGTLLSKGFSDGQGQPADGLELKRTVEAYLEDKAQTLLNGVLGPGKSVVRISTLLNLERIERSVERYDPESAVIRSEERSENDDGEGGGRSESSVTNYEFDRTVESIAGEVGNIERLSVAVIVDGTYDIETDATGRTTKTFVPRSDEEIAKISSIVKSAVGFDPKRNDYFEIASIAFDRSYLEDAERGMEKMLRYQFYVSIARKGAYLGGIIFALILILKLVKKAASILGSAKTGFDFVTRGSPASVETAADLAPIAPKRTENIAAKIASIASQNPDQAADAISSMVEQER